MGEVRFEYHSSAKESKFLNSSIGPSISKSEIENLKDVTNNLDSILDELDESLMKNSGRYLKNIVLYVLHPTKLGSENIIVRVEKANSWDRHDSNSTIDIKEMLYDKLRQQDNIWVCDDKRQMYNVYREHF